MIEIERVETAEPVTEVSLPVSKADLGRFVRREICDYEAAVAKAEVEDMRTVAREEIILALEFLAAHIRKSLSDGICTVEATRAMQGPRVAE